MTTCRKALRTFFFFAVSLLLPLAASAGTFEVKALIDVDHSRSTGCSVSTAEGPIGGVDMVVTTAGTTNGTTASVTSVTRQTCVNATLNLLSSPVAVDGGWNVGISPTGDLTVESHVGPEVITATTVGSPRFVFTASSGLLSDFLLTTYPSLLSDIVLPPAVHVGRQRAAASGPPRVITLDGNGSDWSGVEPLAHGTAAFAGWRFISASVFVGAHDLYFNFQIHTNPAAPTAHDDRYTLGTVGGTLTVAAPGVLGNDNANNQTITAAQTDPPQHGALTLNPNGSFTYIHDGSLVQQDQFRYVAQGPVLPSNVATVTIDLPGSHPYVFTSANAATFTAGQASVFIVTVTGKPTPKLSESGVLPDGIVFTDNGDGTASIFGTPTATSGGVYTLQITAEKNTPHETSQDFTLTVGQAPAITSAAGTTFTTGSLGSFTVTATGFQQPVLTETGALPSGVSFNASTGVLSGTPAPGSGGIYNISFKATNNFGTATQPFVLTVNQAPAITSANNVHLQAGTPANFIVTTTGFPAPALTKSGALPAGVTFTDNGNGTATIGGTPANGSGGTYPLTLTATNAAGTANQPFSIVVCNTIVVNNPATTSGTANTAFSQSFTQVGAVGTASFTLNSGTLPTGLTLSAAGVLSGTPTQTGSFPITVKVTDSNGCIGIGGSYVLTIGCQTITVTNPATNTGTVNIAFSQTFTAGNTIGATTFSTASTLPAGLTLSAGGVLSGTPTQTGAFPIVVKATDANGCSGNGASYSLTIGCQTISVTNPATNSGTVNVAFSQTFTAGNTIGATTFSTASTLPAGITLSAAGVLSGMPTQTGSFPIVVHVVDANGCSGNGATYTLTIGCQVITVNKPATSSGTVNVAFSQTFTTANAIGTATFTTASTLPAGMTLSSSGVLSGTPTQNGSFPIVVHAVDANGCSGNSTTYTLTIACQVITVTNPATATGTVNIAFTRNFTAGNTIGAVTFTTSSALPAGVTLAGNGTLSGTPTQSGTFPIVVTATDANGCPGTGATYNLVIACQVITVTNPATNTGTANIAFSQTFTAGNTIGAVTFSTASGLPTGLTLSAGGVLSGTPKQTGSFPIVVTATDANGCSGSGATYTLTIGCQTISVTNPSTTTGTVNSAFSQSFTAGNTIGTVTFSTASPLPAGLTLAANGTLSGTPTQKGTFPIVVKATDANGCFGSGASYSLVIGCQIITVNNPAGNTGTVSAPFSATFTASNTIGTVTFTTGSTLPAGITLSTAGLLAGTPTQSGTFPIVVTATDANGCPGTGSTYNLIIGCQVITVTNPATTSSPAGTALSIKFTQSAAIGTATFTTSSTLPAGLTLDPDGTLHGTPTQNGPFPIVVTVTDSNGCTGTNPSYTLTLTCPTITVTNPSTSTGTAGTAFSQTFTQSGGLGTITWSKSGALPAGITLNASTGVLSGTPTVVGSFPITVTATDANGCSGSGASYNLVINCQTITVTNPLTNSGTVNIAFSQTFTAGNTIGAVTFSTASGLPAGLTLSSGGVLSGTPTQTGPFNIVVKATDANGCNGSGATYVLTIGCQTISVTNPSTTTGTVNAAFSQTFTAGNTIGTVNFTTASGLPAGLSLSAGGVLSGTPTQTGSFGIVVTATDANGCSGSGSTYTLVIGCQTIPVTNPSTTTGTVSAPFTATFTSSNTIGTVSYTTASGLPAGITLSTGGVLAGTPTQPGTFPIVVKATDANGCFGNSATYTLIISCQVISVTNPATTSDAAGTPLSINFTQSGSIGTATFTTASTLPTGLTLDPDGTLHGTPTQGGPFPISVTITDSNGCTGTNPSYTLTITCPVITVTNPGTSTGTAGVAFSQTFTQSGGQGTITWSKTTGTLPTGITLNSATGVLSGTSNQAGSFPITVTATDQNGCTGTGATYNLNLACQTISITNPGTNTGTVDAPFTATFTVSGILGTATWSEVGALPSSIAHTSSIEGGVRSLTVATGITLNSSTGVLSGTPHVKGVFSITVKVTDSNGCFTTSNYILTINCQTITVTNPATATGTVDAPFSQTFTQSAAHGTATFSTASTLPNGLSLSSAGVLSGTPTNKGTFPIDVTVTDSNTCTGSNSTYNLVIGCQTINVTNPSTTTGTAGTPFSQTFTQSGAHATATFTTASALPSGFSLSTAGVLSGTTTQHGSFPITVTVTDANGCTGSGASYTLVIACNAITVTNPSTTTGTVASPFSQTFTSSGTLISAAYTTASPLPTGLTLHSATGVLDGTPTQSGNFPIVVTVTDGNGCTGAGATYTLSIACNAINVTPPGVTSGTAGTPFSQTFSQSGGNGTIVWSETGDTLPTGISLNTSTGALFGTPTQTGTFNITVTATDGNTCSGSTPYTLTINCQTITITNPATTSIQAGTAVDLIFTASGILGTANWTQTPNTPADTLPGTLALNASTGHLAGTANATGTFNITVKVTDSNGCLTTNGYSLTVTCAPLTVARTGGASFPAGMYNTAYTGQSVVATGGGGSYTYAITSGALPTSLSLSSAGAISGTPSAVGIFNFTVTATDTASNCTGSQAFSISIGPKVTTDIYAASGGNAGTTDSVGNTQSVAGGFSTPGSPYVSYANGVLANDFSNAAMTVSTTTVTDPTFGTINFNSSGGWSYVPKVNFTGTATFAFNVVSGGVTTASSIQIVVSKKVWYVDNNGSNGDGRSNTPFNVLTGTPSASSASGTGDIIYVSTGAGTYNTSTTTTGMTLTTNQQLIGAGVALVVNGNTLKAAGTKPTITNSTATSDAITLGAGNTVQGLKVSNAFRDGISGNGVAGFTGDTLEIGDNTTPTNGNVGSGLHLVGMTGTVTVTNSTITDKSGTATSLALDISGGSGGMTFDNTNTIKSASGTAVSIAARTGGTIGAGATINANGKGIILTNSGASGSPIFNFTGNQTLSTTTNTALTLSGAGAATATTTFSGTLLISTSTGAALDASGAGNTLNITGANNTVSVNTGTAAATELNLNGIKIGASNITFKSVNITGGATGVNIAPGAGSTGTFTIAGTGGLCASGGDPCTGGTIASQTTSGITNSGIASGGLVTINNVKISGAAAGVTTTGTNPSTTLNTMFITGGTNSLSLGGGASTATTITALTTTLSTGASILGNTFGTLTVSGAANSISGASALNLTTGAVSGTFNNVSSTGGTNGVNLSAVTGTWGVTGGTLTGAGGATFNAAGTSTGTLSFGAAISQSNSANVVTISGSHSGTINFTGDVTTPSIGTSTGINISNSSGAYSFTGTNAISAGGITIGATETGSISFGSGTALTGVPFVVTGATTPAITYSGTMSTTAGNFLIDVTGLNTPGGSLTVNGSSVSTTGNGGKGIRIVNSSSTNINIAPTTLTLTMQNNDGVTLAGNTGNITIGGALYSTSGSGNGVLFATTAGSGTVTLGGTWTASGTANVVKNSIGFTGTLKLTNVTASAATGAVVNLTSAFTGTVNLASTSITTGAGGGIVMAAGTLGNASTSGNTITGSGTALSLNAVNLGAVAAFGNISSTAATGISFTNVGGSAFVVGGGTLSGNSTAAFSSVTSTVNVPNFTYNGNITNPTGRVVSINNASAFGCGTLTFGGTINTNVGTGILINFCNAGTITFSGGTKTINTPGTAAANITNSAGTAVYAFTGGGLQLSTTTATAFNAAGTGTLTVEGSGNTITTTTGSGFVNALANGANGITFANVTTNGAPIGVSSTGGGTGVLTVSAGSITSASSFGLQVTGGSGNVTFAPSITTSGSSSATHSVSIGSKTNGTVAISGAVTDNAGGVSLTSNTGATINISGGLTLSTGANPAFAATGGGTVNVTGTNNVTTTTGQAINVTSTTIGASGMTFVSVNRNGGSSTAINLSSTGSGFFSVTGTGTSAGTGGTIQNIVGADAIHLATTGGLVTLKNMNIQDITASTDSSATNDNRSLVDAIQGTNVNAGLTVDRLNIQRISDDGINGSVDGGVPTATVWSGLTVTNSTFNQCNRFNVASHGDAQAEGAIYMYGIKGTVLITGNTFSNDGNGIFFDHTDTSGTLDMTVQTNSFTNLYKEIGTSSVGSYGIFVVQEGSLVSTVRIGDTQGESNAALANTFSNGGDRSAINVITNTGSTGALKVSVAKNTFTVTDHTSPGQPANNTIYNFPQSGVLYRAMGSGNYEGIFAANTMTQCMHADGGLGNLSLIMEKGDSEMIVRNNAFNLPWDAPYEIRADGQAGGQTSAKVQIANNTYGDGIVGDGTTDLGGQSPYEAFYVQVRNGGKMDMTVQNENPFGLTDSSSALGSFSFIAKTTTSGDVFNLFMQNTQSPRGYQLNAAAGTTYNLFKNGSGSVTAQNVMKDNNCLGGGGTDTTNPPTVNTPGAGTVTLTTTAPALPSITPP
jgi:hypothetical protein